MMIAEAIKKRVLLVDDDLLVLRGWKYSLETAGYEVKTASSGEEALGLVEHDRPDCVITDLVMPGMNGVDVCRGIKERYPDLDVVFVSGHPYEIERHMVEFLRAGGRDEYLRKPLLKDEIIDVTDRVTGKNS